VNSTIKTAVFWLVIIISAYLLWETVRSSPNQPQAAEISYSGFLSQVESGNVSKVTISKRQIVGQYRDSGSFRVTAPEYQGEMLENLRQKNVEIWFKDVPSGDSTTWLMNLAPLALLAALWFFMIRQMKSKSSQAQGPGGPPATPSY
jgi:cell division protease FtsH